MSFVICIILIIYLFITILSLETKNVIQFWDFMMNWFEFHGLKVYELKMNFSFHGEWWFQIWPTFMWEACQGILPTNTPLYAMKIGSCTECEVCFSDTMSIVHLQFRCRVLILSMYIRILII